MQLCGWRYVRNLFQLNRLQLGGVETEPVPVPAAMSSFVVHGLSSPRHLLCKRIRAVSIHSPALPFLHLAMSRSLLRCATFGR